MEASRAGPPGRGSRLPARTPLRARVGGSGGGRGAGKSGRPAERGDPGVAPVEGTRWRGRGPAALLAAILLMNSCIQLIGGQDAANIDIPIRLTPLNPTKGQNIFLTPGLDFENFTRCSWYRGTEANSEKLIFTYDQPVFYMVGDAYTGRETLGADCSLHIKHCVMEDSGIYTITIEGGVIATGQVNLDVSGGFDSVDPNHTDNTALKLDAPLPKTPPWKTKDIVGLVLGTLFLVLGLTGVVSLLYPRIRACCHHDKNSTPDMAPPVPSSPPYENIPPAGQGQPRAHH